MEDGIYSTTSAYKIQFTGLTTLPLRPVIWKAWAPLKCTFFAWLITQNRIWTDDRLEQRGLPNCGICQLCKRESEAAHLLFKCRYTIRIWKAVKDWLGIHDLDPDS